MTNTCLRRRPNIWRKTVLFQLPGWFPTHNFSRGRTPRAGTRGEASLAAVRRELERAGYISGARTRHELGVCRENAVLF